MKGKTTITIQNIFLISIIVLFVLILLPYLIDLCVFGNSISSNLTNAEWASFLGGYIGALIGGIISLVGIILTIRFTKLENKKDRELQFRPYFVLWYDKTGNIKNVDIIDILIHQFEDSEERGPIVKGAVYFKNIGVGPAIDCKVEIAPIEAQRKSKFRGSNAVFSAFESGKTMALGIQLYMGFENIPKDSLDIVNGRYQPKAEVFNKYKNFEIKVTITYSDMLNNRFCQSIVLESHIRINVMNGEGTYTCELTGVYTSNKPIKIT